MRGISSAVAAVLIATISVTLVGTTYFFTRGITEMATAETFEIIDIFNDKIILRNTGTKPIEDLKVLVDGNEVQKHIEPKPVEPGRITTITIEVSPGKHELLIVSRSMSQRWTWEATYATTTTLTTTTTTPPATVGPSELAIDINAIQKNIKNYLYTDKDVYVSPPRTRFEVYLTVKNPLNLRETFTVVPSFDRLKLLEIYKVEERLETYTEEIPVYEECVEEIYNKETDKFEKVASICTRYIKEQKTRIVENLIPISFKREDLSKFPTFGLMSKEVKPPERFLKLGFSTSFESNQGQKFKLIFQMPEEPTEGELFVNVLSTRVAFGLDPWWNSNWKYRKEVNITEPNVSFRINWPVNVSLTFAYGTVTN